MAGAGGAPGDVWLDGEVIFCVCPDCQAPMSVRFWLMVADCWRCGASIELSEEHERRIQQLLAERERRRQEESPPQQAAPPVPVTGRRRRIDPSPPPAARSPEPAPARTASPATCAVAPPPPLPPAVPPPVPTASAAATRHEETGESWLSRLLTALPSWLISMLVHLMLLALLALLTTSDRRGADPFITLSTPLSRDVRDGGDLLFVPPDERAQFDLPLPSRADLRDPQQRRALLAAAQDARELRLDDDTPHLPALEQVRERLGRADGRETAFAARDPRLRAAVVTQEGGTTLTEAAVARGLRWLANHQNRDGSWSLKGFAHAADCRCSGDGAYGTKSPGTALALLPFLGAGQTHLAGKYQGTVGRGLRWLIEQQGDDGDLRAGATGNEGMYTHGQAAIVLCEAFAMTGDEVLREPAQRAIDFIAGAQYLDGGWRYRPAPRNQRGDTSVLGWQLMALQSARAAGLPTPEDTWTLAELYLDGVQHRDGALYAYQKGGSPTATMTAEALLCRLYLGWGKDRPGLVRGVRWLHENHLPEKRDINIYYWYYATQVLHHYGGQEWDDWNLRMRDILVNQQETRGHAAGSWAPRGEHAGAGGRIYMTALAVCTLEVYYRHLPIFRQLNVEPEDALAGPRTR